MSGILGRFNHKMFSFLGCILKCMYIYFGVFVFSFPISIHGTTDFCTSGNLKGNGDCSEKTSLTRRPRFIFYDVNPAEGFNLRRDVYMRLAIMMQRLMKNSDWHLVLPPWPHLYHWRSKIKQHQLPWSLFFDLRSLRAFSPVVDLQEYFTEVNQSTVEQVYILQHFKGDWEEGRFEEKRSIESCNEPLPYMLEDDGTYSGSFWGYSNISAMDVKCLSFHGRASQLAKYISEETKAETILIDHAEVLLHDSYGDEEYWRARRSMRFSHLLVEKARKFRNEVLNSTDENDKTVRPSDWRHEMEDRSAVGGPYMCVHLRRRDFLWGRPKDVPSLQSAAEQLKRHLSKFNLLTVFVATDAPEKEFFEIQSLLKEFKVLRYIASPEEYQHIKDGGVAIIEQIICSHARFFVGTHESTFSYRIQEEREIMGFNPSTTFNSLCGDSLNSSCPQPSRWLAVF